MQQKSEKLNTLNSLEIERKITTQVKDRLVAVRYVGGGEKI